MVLPPPKLTTTSGANSARAAAILATSSRGALGAAPGTTPSSSTPAAASESWIVPAYSAQSGRSVLNQSRLPAQRRGRRSDAREHGDPMSVTVALELGNQPSGVLEACHVCVHQTIISVEKPGVLSYPLTGGGLPVLRNSRNSARTQAAGTPYILSIEPRCRRHEQAVLRARKRLLCESCFSFCSSGPWPRPRLRRPSPFHR